MAASSVDALAIEEEDIDNIDDDARRERSDSFEEAVAQSVQTATSPRLAAPARSSSLVGGLHASAAGGLPAYDAAALVAQRRRTEARAAAVAAECEALAKHTLVLALQVFEPSFEDDAESAQALRAAVDVMRARLERGECAAYVANAEARAYCSAPVNLRRFAIDAHFNAAKAFEKLEATLEWRVRMRPWELDSTRLGATLRLGAVQLTGTDAWGRPVMVIDLPRTGGNATNEQLLDLIYAHFEHLRVRVARARGVLKWALLFNLERQTVWNMPSVGVITEVLKALLSSFPEFCGNTILWQPPMAFKAVWYALRPFLDADTLKKVVFVSGDSAPATKVDTQMRALLGEDWRALSEVDHVRGSTRFNEASYAQNFERACDVVRAAALVDPNADYP